MATGSAGLRRASAIVAAAALIVPSIALAADGGGGAGVPVVEPASPPASGGSAAPAPPPVPTLQPTADLGDETAAQPPATAAADPEPADPAPRPPAPAPRRAVASQETEQPGEVPKLQHIGKGKKRREAEAAQSVEGAAALPHTGYVPLSVATLGLAMLAAGLATLLLVPLDERRPVRV